jgi:hypothetical protein
MRQLLTLIVLFVIGFQFPANARKAAKTITYSCTPFGIENKEALFEVKIIGFSDYWNVIVQDQTKRILKNSAVFRKVRQMRKPDRDEILLLTGKSQSKQERVSFSFDIISKIENGVILYSPGLSFLLVIEKDKKDYELDCKSEYKSFV